MKISYAICTCNEDKELHRLLTVVINNKREVDEIVIVYDEDNTTTEVMSVLKTFEPHISKYPHKLNKNFAEHKNFMNSKCVGEMIFNLDADETIEPEFIIQLPEILKENWYVDLFYVGRINTVENITLSYVEQMRWKITHLDNFINTKLFGKEDQDEYELLKQKHLIIGEVPVPAVEKVKVKYFKPIINFPDAQPRIYRNFPTIYWGRAVHETIVGVKKMSQLPYEQPYCILHPKTLEKQIKQNLFYQSI